MSQRPLGHDSRPRASNGRSHGCRPGWRCTARSAVYELREIREDARTWLSFLAEIGYPLSSVEQAIVDDEPFQEGEPDAADTDGQAGLSSDHFRPFINSTVLLLNVVLTHGCMPGDGGPTAPRAGAQVRRSFRTCCRAVRRASGAAAAQAWGEEECG
jgi:hypothetical protein